MRDLFMMVKRAPMKRSELAVRLGVSERNVRDLVRARGDVVHEWDGQVYAGAKPLAPEPPAPYYGAFSV